MQSRLSKSFTLTARVPQIREEQIHRNRLPSTEWSLDQ
jgi:hypothetical protein